MVLVADRIYQLNSNTYTVLAFYISRHVQPNEELSWYYGTLFDRAYPVGHPSTGDFEIYMTVPRLTRLLTHRPDGIFGLSTLERAQINA